MSNMKALLAAGLLPGAVLLAAAGEGGPQAYAAGPVTCEIQVSSRGGGVTLEGVVHARTAIEGSYQLKVSNSGGSGGSAINQSGDFSAGPGEAASLATVTLGGRGSYVARLQVSWSGGSTACSQRVGGLL